MSECGCCNYRSAEDHCCQCYKPLCLPCSYLFRDQSFCRLTFRDCQNQWLLTRSISKEDELEYRSVIPCAHTDKQHELEKKRNTKNKARRQAKRDRQVLDASQGVRDLSFFIPNDQLESVPDHQWLIWKRQAEFDQFMANFKPSLLASCRPFNYFWHSHKGRLSHGYRLTFNKSTESADNWRQEVNKFCQRELYPQLREKFQVSIRD